MWSYLHDDLIWKHFPSRLTSWFLDFQIPTTRKHPEIGSPISAEHWSLPKQLHLRLCRPHRLLPSHIAHAFALHRSLAGSVLHPPIEEQRTEGQIYGQGSDARATIRGSWTGIHTDIYHCRLVILCLSFFLSVRLCSFLVGWNSSILLFRLIQVPAPLCFGSLEPPSFSSCCTRPFTITSLKLKTPSNFRWKRSDLSRLLCSPAHICVA